MAAGTLLASPVFTAFRSGGYGIKSQLIVAIAVFAMLAVVAIAAPWPLLPGGPAAAALAALAGYCVWTGLSTAWAKLLDTAAHDTYRVVTYCAAFALALAVARVRSVRRAAPEVLLASIALVCMYALAGRLLPHLVHQRAVGAEVVRLSQPLTYWNALGMLAGFGALLGVATAGDETRPLGWRALACAIAVPCSLAAFFTLSRGAAGAVVAGLVVCVALRRRRATLLAVACVLGSAIVLGLACIAFPDVLSPGADSSAQASQGAWYLALAALVTVATGLGYRRLAGSPLGRGPLRIRARRAGALAAGSVPAILLVSVAIAGHGRETTSVPVTSSRVIHTETDRGRYWRVALGAFGRHPLNGVGSGSFAAEWAQHRGSGQPALDAHSLYIETLAELGLVGALLLAGFVASVAVGTVRAARSPLRDAPVVAGATVLAAFAVHLGLDWDWEMPAVTLVALILAAGVMQPAGSAGRRV